MSDIKRWLIHPPKWTEEHLKLIPITKRVQQSVSLEDVIQKSDEFIARFPIDTMRNKTLLDSVPKQILERNVQSAYPIIHEAVLHLCAEFLLFKVKHGTVIENELYLSMSVLQFIQRLLTKRSVMFVGTGKNENYILRNGFMVEGYQYCEQITGPRYWKSIGTENQKYPLYLEEYLSNDELKLSAFLSISSYSYFINSGSRRNNGIPEENRENIESEGIIIGLVGTKLIKSDAMEFQEIIITQKQNTVLNGYGDCNTPSIQNLFSTFYETCAPLYNNIRYAPIDYILRFKDLHNGYIFDNEVYAKRLAVSFDTLLLEANHRAQERNKFAYIYVIGIGLGTWRISDHQEDIFVDTLGSRISALAENLNSVTDIHLSYFGRTINCQGYINGDLFPIRNHPNGGVKIFISERDPFTSLQDPEKLLVVSYASDSNALPGNEFWRGCMENSSNSATAASSQIAENHNPIINLNVCADNLMVATMKGVIPVYDYMEHVHKFVADNSTDVKPVND